jgi:hypothetical protein
LSRTISLTASATGGGHVNDHVYLAGVDPPAHDIRPDVRLVLMIGADDLNLHTLGGGAEILNCHARCDHRASPAQIGIGARHVVKDADFDGAVGVLRLRAGAAEGDGEGRETDEQFHWRFSVAKVPYFGLGSTPR